MFESIGRSWQVTKLTIEVIKKDQELILFPIFAGIFSILLVVAMAFPLILNFVLAKNEVIETATFYFILFAIYFGLSFIATFFNVCVVYTAKKRFEGGDSKFFEALGFAFSKVHLIIAWSLVSATVGIFLKILDGISERMGFVGELIMKLVIMLLGAAWSLITVFVVPSMIYYNIGPFAAIKKSVETLKKTWGETLVKEIGFGLIEFFLIMAGVGVIFLSVFLIEGIALLAIISFAIIFILAVVIFFSLADSVYNTALFAYAETGKIPAAYTPEVIKGAFKRVEKKGLF